jgi:glycosyltransferase involved in cell wall biosynthesis
MSSLIEIVSATRFNAADFAAKSALGLSLARLDDKRLVPRIACDNRRGLPEVYNDAIAAAGDTDMVVFMHDDVWIDDTDFADRIIDGLDRFDVIGVAGNRRCMPGQTSWLLINGSWDAAENLSGSVGHGEQAHGEVTQFGPVPAPCQLLDGLFLAGCKSTLNEAQVRFDPQFNFHFYDMDFCRSATKRALSLGTWPIALTHQSPGAFIGPDWDMARQRYLAKWERSAG